MKHLSERLVDRPAVLFVSGLAMIGIAALLRSTPFGIPIGVLAAGIGFAMAGLGAMLMIGSLAVTGLGHRSNLKRLRAWIVEETAHSYATGHHAH